MTEDVRTPATGVDGESDAFFLPSDSPVPPDLAHLRLPLARDDA